MERAPVVAPLSDRAVMVPPLNFAMVAPGVYRSGYPNKKNFPFLSKLGLKSIMCARSGSPCFRGFVFPNRI